MSEKEWPAMRMSVKVENRALLDPESFGLLYSCP